MANFERMIYRLVLVIMIFAGACNVKNETVVNSTPIENSDKIIDDTTGNFFPVTAYLKGEIYGIKSGGITPIKKTTANNKTDSVWLNVKDYVTEFSSFLSPIIDTTNLKNIFTEKRFLDQTLNAFTFTYDPISTKADTFAFKHWDVYVDPETNKVKRIYLSKKVDEETDLKLFWESEKWCKIITVKNLNGKSFIAKEEKISWSYD